MLALPEPADGRYRFRAELAGRRSGGRCYDTGEKKSHLAVASSFILAETVGFLSPYSVSASIGRYAPKTAPKMERYLIN
jgi:hypothetical protein